MNHVLGSLRMLIASTLLVRGVARSEEQMVEPVHMPTTISNLLSPAQEVELALSAGPEHLRADIGISRAALKDRFDLPFVYSGYSGGTRTGYIIVRARQAKDSAP